MIVKSVDSGYGWYVYHSDLTANTYYLRLDTNAAESSGGATIFNSTSPTSTVFSIGTNSEINSAEEYMFMAFAPSQFISIGSYLGNGNANGTSIPFVNSLGVPLSPKWVLAKNYEEVYGWFIVDQQTSPYNVRDKYLDPATTAAEATSNNFDFVTGGAKFRNTGGWNNTDKGVIYLAIGTPIIDTAGRIIAGR